MNQNEQPEAANLVFDLKQQQFESTRPSLKPLIDTFEPYSDQRRSIQLAPLSTKTPKITGLSPLTASMNNILVNSYKEIQSKSKSMFKEIRSRPLPNNEGMLQKADFYIQKAIARIKQVNDYQDTSKQLSENQTLPLILYEGIPIHVKILAKNMDLPCKISFDYENTGSVQVFYSMKSSDRKDGFAEGRPRNIFIGKKGKMFTKDYIFVTLSAEFQMVMSMTAHFHQKVEKKESRYDKKVERVPTPKVSDNLRKFEAAKNASTSQAQT